MSFERDIRELEEIRARVNSWLMVQLIHDPAANVGLEIRKSLDVATALMRSISKE